MAPVVTTMMTTEVPVVPVVSMKSPVMAKVSPVMSKVASVVANVAPMMAVVTEVTLVVVDHLRPGGLDDHSCGVAVRVVVHSGVGVAAVAHRVACWIEDII